MHKGVAPCTILYTLDNITRVPEFLDLHEDLMQHFHFKTTVVYLTLAATVQDILYLIKFVPMGCTVPI